VGVVGSSSVFFTREDELENLRAFSLRFRFPEYSGAGRNPRP
jgi:hypothetical protein